MYQSNKVAAVRYSIKFFTSLIHSPGTVWILVDDPDGRLREIPDHTDRGPATPSETLIVMSYT